MKIFLNNSIAGGTRMSEYSPILKTSHVQKAKQTGKNRFILVLSFSILCCICRDFFPSWEMIQIWIPPAPVVWSGTVMDKYFAYTNSCGFSLTLLCAVIVNSFPSIKHVQNQAWYEQTFYGLYLWDTINMKPCRVDFRVTFLQKNHPWCLVELFGSLEINN